MKSFEKLLFLSLVIFSGKFCFASDDCEAVKRAILNDCDTIESYCDNATNKLRTAYVALNSASIKQYILGPESGTPQATYPYLSDSLLYDSSGNSLGVTVGYYLNEISRANASVNLIYPQIRDIRNRVNAVQCIGSNTCNCAEYLEPIQQDVNRIKDEVVSIQTIVDEMLFYIVEISENLSSIVDNFDNVFDYFDYVTNQLSQAQNWQSAISPNFWLMQQSGTEKAWAATYWKPFQLASQVQSSTIRELIGYGLRGILLNVGSLNNYSHSNTTSIVSIYKSSVSNNVALGTISRVLDGGFDGVTNQFSIFIGASAGASPVLGEYTSNDGSYHDYLTNYYIKVSGSSVSGSTPLTNWFNRIEMLLAALVFQDDDGGPKTNNIPSSSSYDNLESELNENMGTINQQGQDYLSTVDTSGKSLLSMLREWNSAVTGISRPSPFVIVSIPDSSQASPSRSGSSLDITLDTDNQSLAGFVELVRGVTTLAWVTLFLVVGYFLSIRIITLIGKLISFGYSVYSAVFGGG